MARTRQVTHGSGQENLHASWSWDGRFLYYYRQRPERSWRRIGVDGQGDVEIVKGWMWATHNNPEISPSGRCVLYTRIGFDTGDYSNDTTYIYDLEKGTQRALDPPHLHMAHWSPDGRLAAGFRHDGMPFYPPSPDHDVTPDGRAVFAQFEAGRRELWMRDLP